ncbi:MAG: PKD domain-containing protein [Halobacteriota archaeon]|jgi:PKD repeat protein
MKQSRLGGVMVIIVAVAVLIAGCTAIPAQNNTAQQLPIAHAGGDQKVKAGSVVTLNGSASSAPRGAALTYDWSLSSVPKGSAAHLVNQTSDRPAFTPDKIGIYVVSLVVSDSAGTKSTPDATNITVIPAERSNTTLTANVSKTDFNIGDTIVISGRLIDADGNGIPNQAISFNLEAHVLGGTYDVPVNSTTTGSTGAFTQSVPAEESQNVPSFITTVNLEGWAVYAGNEAYKPSTTEHVNMVLHL